MYTKSNDEFEDGDFDDYDDADDFDFASALVTDELTDELVRYWGDLRRIEEENKVIRVNLSLTAALNKIPAKWLDAACQANRLALQGNLRKSRRAKVAALVASLTSKDELRRCVTELPPRARAALRRVVDNGGWMRLADLTRDFGSMDGDGWFWDEVPPTSCLGELRRRALLFVGRTSRTKDGKLGKRMFKVAVVPRDIRDLLRSILSEAAICREEEAAFVKRFAKPEDALNDAICAAHGYYDVLDWQPPLERCDVEDFLRYVSRHGFDPVMAWFGIEILLAFIETRLHEIQSLDDLCGYHISELASGFVDMSYMQRWTLDERRNLIHLVRYLYDRLYERGRILVETRDEVRRACARLVSGKRKLNLIRRPPPIGGELIFIRVNPNTGEEERYTFNHQRLLMVWAGAFHQDWRTMLSVCETVPSGAQKAALIHELIALEPSICDLIISQADEEDFDRAILWFYEDRLLELSAW
ncbi:MAG: hypothetical protein RMN52_15485 [Anaerolineae bacterium]|nr:hypothetical protein [Candidatus Roseilinea sp.]MDW8451400.1 hypothetical protein [Anaerolineae bacterium]